MRSVVGRCVCGVGLGLGTEAGDGEAPGLGACVLRGRSWPRPAIPRDETIKSKTASTPIHLRFFSTTNFEHLIKLRDYTGSPFTRNAPRTQSGRERQYSF